MPRTVVPTAFTPHERVFSNPGTRICSTYQLCYGKDGKRDLEEVGKINMYEQIQSHRSSCDLKILLDRYKNGDVMALNAMNSKQPIYGDFSNGPENLAEIYSRINQVEMDFAGMPVNIRAQFNFSVTEYLASLGGEKWMKAFKIGAAAEPEKGSVNNDESKSE